MSPGSPAGSYALSGFDDVNLFNGNLNFRLPLLTIGGRGSAGYTMMLATSTKKWQVKTEPGLDENGGGGPIADKFTPQWKNWNSTNVGYGPGVMQGRKTGVQTIVRRTCDTCPIICPRIQPLYRYTLTRLTFISADGTEHELRDEGTNGKPMLVDDARCFDGGVLGYLRGKRFISADGSAMTFVSDADIYDNVLVNPNGGQVFPVSGTLYLRNGTRYGIVAGQVTWIEDRNGNRVTYSATEITDSLNRKVTIEYDLNEAPYGLHDRITYKGFGGASRVIRISKTTLSGALRAPYTIKNFSQLFPELNGTVGGGFDPAVVSTVWLPDNRSYKIFYNSYAEVARVELPTGGAFEYDMVPGSGVIASTVGLGIEERQIYRRLKERRTYTGLTADTLETRTVYTAGDGVNLSSDSPVKVEQFDNGGHLLAVSRHYFSGSAAETLFTREEGSLYSPAGEGRETITESLDPTNQTTVLRRVGSVWQQRAPVAWVGNLEERPPNYVPEGLAIQPDNDPRLTKVVTTLETNQVSQQEYAYDNYNNRIDVKEYDYGAGSPGALVRRTHIDYLTLNPVNSANYDVTNIHIRDLPVRTSVYDAGDVERARTTFEYDHYTLAPPSHSVLTDCPNISGANPAATTGYTTRGNLTGTTNYLLANGTVTGSVSSYSQYDIAGNIVKVIDALGHSSTIDFADHFGSPDSEAQANLAPAELTVVGQSSYAFPTKVTNAIAHVSYSQFDYYVGVLVNGEDSNGVVVSTEYGNGGLDLLDRPSRLIRAINHPSVKSQTKVIYNDAARTITTTMDLNVFDDNLLKSETVYDGLGRTTETRQYESVTDFIAVRQVPFVVLQDGTNWLAASQTSNPFRPSEQPVWTTSFSDSLGRITKVKTPDNAVVTTSYSGNTVTVTDQISKARKSVSDALGRLKEVYEDPGQPPAQLNYLTSYGYDALDNLISVSQGGQQRFFVYDSLKRLVRARNPEQNVNSPGLDLTDSLTGNNQWSVGYQYDSNGNLIQKTDARGVVSTYIYDSLNRNTTINFSNTTDINPDITRIYDGATKGKGRIWKSYAGGDAANGTTVEYAKVESYDELGRPLSQLQQFKTNSTWGATYQTQRAYNRAGGVTQQIYPSGHTVNYNYDGAGRLGDKDAQNLAFTGNLGDGVSRTYSSGIIYSSLGGMVKEKFGTDTPLYNKSFYNNRGQLSEIRVGTTYTGPNDSDWQRGAIINHYSQCWGACSGPDNNGNLKKQNVFIPHNDQMQPFTVWTQEYDYDSLNRLQRVREGTMWQQEYVYDRWGNRTIHQTNTFGTGINKKDFAVEPGSNRLYAPGDLALAESLRQMQYDAAGNLKKDTYTGAGERFYDAENRMTKALGGGNQLQEYTYKADGQRVRRKVDGVETWQVYGMDGELLAEYALNAPFTSPQKEYGYRSGQLLITAEPASGGPRLNVALASNGATVTASSQYNATFPAAAAINGDRYHLYQGDGTYNMWHSATGAPKPDGLEVDFHGLKSIDEINVVTMQDDYNNPVNPTETTTFNTYGITNFEVQYWDGAAWVAVPGASVTGNNKVWRKFTFASLTTSKIKVQVSASLDGFTRLMEVEALWDGSRTSAQQLRPERERRRGQRFFQLHARLISGERGQQR